MRSWATSTRSSQSSNLLSKYRLADVDYLEKFNGGAVGLHSV